MAEDLSELYDDEVVEPDEAPSTAQVQADAEEDHEADATDAAVAKAEELNVDLAEVEGTGAEGRITVDDVEAYAPDQPAEPEPIRLVLNEDVFGANPKPQHVSVAGFDEIDLSTTAVEVEYRHALALINAHVAVEAD